MKGHIELLMHRALFLTPPMRSVLQHLLQHVHAEEPFQLVGAALPEARRGRCRAFQHTEVVLKTCS